MAVARSNSEAGKSDKTPSEPGLPQVPLVRQTSPRLVSSFQLADGQSWDSTFIIDVDESPNAESSRGGYADRLLTTLSWFGWLKQDVFCNNFRIPSYLIFSITISMDLFVIATTVDGKHFGNDVNPRHFANATAVDDQQLNAQALNFRQIHLMDSIFRHTLVLIAHLGVFLFGGNDLASALRGPDLALPLTNVLFLGILMIVEYGIDFTRFSRLLGVGHHIKILRRLFIMVGRLPSAVSLMVMLSMPKRLCQDLVRVVMALESSDISEAHRLYSVFWKRLRMARRWYNAVMTPHFLIAVCRLPICLFTLTNMLGKKTLGEEITDESWLEKKREQDLEMIWLVSYTVVDVVQMFFWIQPAIIIRMNHGVALSAAVEQAGHPTVRDSTTKARELATMMASLHPLVGLKFLGFIVTWRLVLQVQTLTTLGMTCLNLSFTTGDVPSTTMTTTSMQVPVDARRDWYWCGIAALAAVGAALVAVDARSR